jgi:hypothetical protein
VSLHGNPGFLDETVPFSFAIDVVAQQHLLKLLPFDALVAGHADDFEKEGIPVEAALVEGLRKSSLRTYGL